MHYDDYIDMTKVEHDVRVAERNRREAEALAKHEARMAREYEEAEAKNKARLEQLEAEYDAKRTARDDEAYDQIEAKDRERFERDPRGFEYEREVARWNR